MRKSRIFFVLLIMILLFSFMACEGGSSNAPLDISNLSEEEIELLLSESFRVYLYGVYGATGLSSSDDSVDFDSSRVFIRGRLFPLNPVDSKTENDSYSFRFWLGEYDEIIKDTYPEYGLSELIFFKIGANITINLTTVICGEDYVKSMEIIAQGNDIPGNTLKVKLQITGETVYKSKVVSDFINDKMYSSYEIAGIIEPEEEIPWWESPHPFDGALLSKTEKEILDSETTTAFVYGLHKHMESDEYDEDAYVKIVLDSGSYSFSFILGDDFAFYPFHSRYPVRTFFLGEEATISVNLTSEIIGDNKIFNLKLMAIGDTVIGKSLTVEKIQIYKKDRWKCDSIKLNINDKLMEDEIDWIGIDWFDSLIDWSHYLPDDK